MEEDRYLCCKNYCKVKTGGYLVAYFESILLTALVSYISANVAVRRACCDAAQAIAIVGCVLQSLFLGVLVAGLWRKRIAYLRFSLITILLRILVSFMLTVSFGMMGLLSAHSKSPAFSKFSTSDTVPFMAVLLTHLIILTVCFGLLRKYFKLALDVEINLESTILSHSTKSGSLRKDTTVVTDAADDIVVDIEAQLKADNEARLKGATVVEFQRNAVTELQTKNEPKVPVAFASIRPYTFLLRQQRHLQQQQSCGQQNKQPLWILQKQQRAENNINRQKENEQCQQIYRSLESTKNVIQQQQQRQQLEVVFLEKENVLSHTANIPSYNFGQQHYCRRPSPATILIATQLTSLQRRPPICAVGHLCYNRPTVNAVRPIVNNFARI